MLEIYEEKHAQERFVEEQIREAFWNVYRPGCYEHYLIHCLRKDKDFVKELNLVCEENHQIIGHLGCVKSCIILEDGNKLDTLTLGPICIFKPYQNKGYGLEFLNELCLRAKALGYKAICLEGNINFYGKAGFVEGNSFNIQYESEASAPYFLVKELEEGYLCHIKGTYYVPKAYYIDLEKIDEFDLSFPPKEKLVLPGQLG